MLNGGEGAARVEREAQRITQAGGTGKPNWFQEKENGAASPDSIEEAELLLG
jgi:hypothetical protein